MVPEGDPGKESPIIALRRASAALFDSIVFRGTDPPFASVAHALAELGVVQPHCWMIVVNYHGVTLVSELGYVESHAWRDILKQ